VRFRDPIIVTDNIHTKNGGQVYRNRHHHIAIPLGCVQLGSGKLRAGDKVMTISGWKTVQTGSYNIGTSINNTMLVARPKSAIKVTRHD
jgi:hypothetical protein